MATMETVINPKQETVEAIKYDNFKGEFNDYRIICEAKMLTFVRLYENGDGVYLDDEGLYSENQHFWVHKNYPQPLVNIGVFVGVDDEGETIPARTSFKQLQKDVKFVGDRYSLALIMRVMSHKISTENGYEDYRPIFFS